MGFFNPDPYVPSEQTPASANITADREDPNRYGGYRPEWAVGADSKKAGNRYMEGLGMEQGEYAYGLGHQKNALGLYGQQAMGLGGPSQAQAQMQQMGDRNMAQQMQMSAMGRSGNMAGQARSAQAGGLAAQQATNHQLAQLRAQEQQQAMAAYAGLGTQLAGQSTQRTGMYEGNMMGLMDLDWQRMQHESDKKMRIRDQMLERDRFKKEQNLDWANFGMNAWGGVMEGIGGALGGF